MSIDITPQPQAAKRGRKSSKPPVELTPEELALQQEKGLLYRELIESAVEEFLKYVQSPGLLLSGGLDSRASLWSLMKYGVKPQVFTFEVPGHPVTSDAKKARKIAETYNLDFSVVRLPEDPEEIAAEIAELAEKYDELKTRADLEVLFIMSKMMDYASVEKGCDAMFSGISDTNIHLLSRKLEIMGRQGKMSVQEANIRRIQDSDDYQANTLIDIAASKGMSLCLPSYVAGLAMPYNDVPWHVMNVPARKSISLRAWRAEAFEDIDATSVKPQPLQCGDSGTRQYFDSKIKQSKLAFTECGNKEPSTAIVYYNALKKRIRGDLGRGENPDPGWDLWRSDLFGTELPKGVKRVYPLDENGRSTYQAYLDEESRSNPVAMDGDSDLFADIDDGPTICNYDESGEPDSRVDCWGIPFWTGDDNAWTDCPRAMKGLCGTGSSEGYYEYSCTSIYPFMNTMVRRAQIVADAAQNLPVYPVYAGAALMVESKIKELKGSAD